MSKNRQSREWSWKIDCGEIAKEKQDVTIRANEDARRAVAKRIGVRKIDSLEVTAGLYRQDGGHVIHVEGVITARLWQDCVVTLEPVVSDIRESFESFFADSDHVVTFSAASRRLRHKNKDNEIPMLDENEDPEPVENGEIDLGEVATQYLSLAVNPYPHAPGAAHAEGDEGETLRQPSELRRNPFAALQYWDDEDGDGK